MNDLLIKKSLKKGVSYLTYRKLIKDLIEKKKSTGKNQSDNILNMSILNDKRMNRLDKTLKLTEETVNLIRNVKSTYTFLVIAEGWCADGAQILPIINKITETSANFNLKIVSRDENNQLMNEFLTNGNESIPIIIILDQEKKIVNSWGPRPSKASKMAQEYKKTNGKIDADFKRDLQIWYNKDKGHNTQEDIMRLLKAS
jgi:hypothetical protein